MFRHLLKFFHWRRIGWRPFIGVILLAVNVPFGYGGAALCAMMAAGHPDRQRLWLAAAGGVYALSWLMLLAGTCLAGPAVVRAFRQRVPRAWRACRRKRQSNG